MADCPFRKIASYGDALQIEPLLQLQRPLSPEAPHHDELQYVIIHQVSELWFKLLLHELDEIGRLMRSGEAWEGARLLRRATQIVHLIDGGFHLMETMTALDYATFRPNLAGGSGFQSAQFREVEVALGAERDGTLGQAVFTPAERSRLQARLDGPDLWDSFLALLRARGYAVHPREAAAAETIAALQAAYRADADLRTLMEELTALENALLAWRFHHAAMAERAIGAAAGTGGAGVAYLYETAKIRAFPELLAMRSGLHTPLP
jgi:tryptophan 2,3-dioxygenase